MSKTKIKFIITFVTVVFAMILFNTNTVNATTITSDDGKVFTENEITDNLINLISENVNNSEITGYWINQDTLKTIDLILEESTLNSFLQEDNYVYQNIYYQLDDEITRVTINYSNQEEDAEIVTKNGIRYAELPIAVAIKIDGEYYSADLRCDGVKNISQNSSFDLNLYEGSELMNTLNFFTCVEDGQTYAASVYVTSTTSEDYVLGGAGGTTVGGNSYDRILAEGDCYINVDIFDEYIGETLELAPFGTLTYSGTRIENDITMYNYKAQITDKTIFNNDTIITKIVLKDYKVLCTAFLYFEGDLIETSTSINLTSEQTDVKLEADTSVVPSNTILSVVPITEGNTYETVVDVLTNVTQFVAYDITLLSDGVEIQPNGNVKISIPIPEGYDTSKLVVYRIDEDGAKTKYDVTVTNGYAVFETDHFSTYVLAEEGTTETLRNNETTEELDNTPKTGINNTSIWSIVLLIIVSTGIVLIRKK